MKLTHKKFENYRYFYVYALAVWISFNSLAPIRRAGFSKIVSVLFGFLGIILFLIYLYQGEARKHPILKTSVLVVLASILSFVANGFIYPVKNIYSIFSLVINFFILFTFAQDENFNEKIVRISKTLFIIITLVSLINLSLVFFEVSIQIGDINNPNFIGLDSYRGRFTGLQLNPNGLSRYSLAGIISAMTVLTFAEDKVRLYNKKVYIFGVFINILVVLLSQSRGTILALVTGLFMILFANIFFKMQRNNILKTILFFILMTIIYVGSIFINFELSELLVDNFPSISSLDRSSSKANSDVEYIGSGKYSKLASVDFMFLAKDNQPKGPLVSRSEFDEELLQQDITNGRITLIRNGVSATLERQPLFGLTYAANTEVIQDYLDRHALKVPNYMYHTAGAMHNTIFQSYINNGVLGILSLVIFLLVPTCKYVVEMFSVKTGSKMIEILLFFSFIFGIMFILNMVEWVFYFDFDNHLLNLYNMVFLGWFMTVKER